MPEQQMEHKAIGQLATNILYECSLKEKKCQTEGIVPPNLVAGTSTAFWSEVSPELGLLENLTALLQGPHDFLHEFVASNWDHSALYVFLQSQTLEYIASSGGRSSLYSLSRQSGIPEDKLVQILELLCCRKLYINQRMAFFCPDCHIKGID